MRYPDSSINSLQNSLDNKYKDQDTYIQNDDSSERYTQMSKEKIFIQKPTKHFFCNKCKSVPIIEMKSYEETYYKCRCNDIIINKPIKELLKLNICQDNKDGENNENPVNYLYCQESSHENYNFSYYCEVCKKNLCKKCLELSNSHNEHILNIFIFDKYNYNIKELKENLNICLVKEKYKDFIKLINIIFDDYTFYPNFSHFEIFLKSLFLSNLIKNNLIITNPTQLELDIINSKNIQIIKLPNKGFNINRLENLNLENLVELYLNENKINNIELLSKKKFKNLKILDLAVNEIDNSNIKYFFNLNSPKLAKLNIYQNKITDAEIFKLKNNPNNLPKLELFYIGKNNIVFNEEQINIEETQFNFNFIYMLGFSSNVFNQETIKFIQCFTIPNVEFLYLGNNNLINLDFIEKLTLPYLKEFHLEDNQISEFERLTKFKNLEVINMENNKIQNIENLEEFIEELKYLREFNLLKNKFINPLISKGILEVIKEKNIVLYDPITEY